MATPWTPTPANVTLAGLSKIYLQAIGDDAFYEFPNFSDGFINISPVTASDNAQRTLHQGGWVAEITWNALNVSVANLIKNLLPAMCAEKLHVYALGNDLVSKYSSKTIQSSTGWFGLKWEYQNDGDAQKAQMVRFTMKRFLTDAEYLLFINSSAPALGTPNASDALYSMLSLAYTDKQTCGFRLLEFSAAGAATWNDSIDRIGSSKFTAELLTEDDDALRPVAVGGVRIAVEGELKQASAVEQEQLKTIQARANDVRATLQNGTLCTFTQILGAMFTFQSAKNSDGPAVIRMAASGIIPLSLFDNIWP